MGETVLLVGDTHASSGWMRQALRIADKHAVDHILQLGDFGFWPHTASGKLFLNNTIELLEHYDQHMYWIDGNHENHDWLAEQDHIEGDWTLGGRLHHWDRGARWEWGGRSFLACGGAYSIDKYGRIEGESWWAGETITEGDVLRCGTEHAAIMVTHDAPWGTPNVMGFETVGEKDDYPESVANRKRLAAIADVVNPSLLVHGHYHHRNTALYKGTRVEGFGRDGDYSSLGLLDLDTLAVSRVTP